MSKKIVIVNGSPAHIKTQLSPFLKKLREQASLQAIQVSYFTLHEKDIRSCIGCWDCWWKTPGLCRHTDDMSVVLKAIINSDLIIYASPLIIGMYSALLKKFHDRTVPLVHPYVEIKNGENHHKKRYPKYPKMGVIIDENDASQEEISNVKYIFNRIAINFHSEVQFFYSVQQANEKTVSHEISHF
jgi:multimeric flavodoxin WrbA